jgi:radical SAM protein with 4Fe4S-binding SPASM domain
MHYANRVKTMNDAFAKGAAQANAQELVNMPVDITVTLSLACNYRCSMCYQDRYDKTLPLSAIERLAPLLPFARTFQLFGGEPLLYKHIQKLYKLGLDNDCQISMISNGSLLSEDMVESIVANHVHHIKFSIDAGSPATYKKIRGGNYFEVLKGVALLAKRKIETRSPFPYYDFNFLAMRSNVKELSRLVVTASELGVNCVNVFYPSMHKDELADDCVFFDQERSDEMLSRAREVAKRLDVGLRLPPLFCESNDEEVQSHDPCNDPWTKLLVGVDGDLSLCCAGDTSIGNINDADFEANWNGERARSLRKVVNTPREPLFCKRCRIRRANPNDPALHMPREILAKRGLLHPTDSLAASA